MRLDRAGTRLAAGVVAAVAGYSSWQHIVAVAERAGEHASVAAVMPLSIDGLIVVSTLAMLEDKRADRHPRLSARIGLVLGIACTLAFNLGSAEPEWDSRGVAAVPAAVFLVAVEILSRTGKPRQPASAPVPVPAEVTLPPVSLESPKLPLPTDPGPGLERQPVPATPVAPSVPAQRRRRAVRRQEVITAPTSTTAERVREAAEAMPDAGPERLAVELGVSERTVRRYLPAATAPAADPLPVIPDDASELVPDPTTGGVPVPALSAT